MRQKYFKKDKKAMVYMALPEKMNEYGDRISEGYMPITPSPLWCYTKQVNQGLKTVAKTLIMNDEARLFVFNYNELIKPEMYIFYKKEWYQITRVDTEDDYKGQMFVYVDEAPVGAVSRLGDEQPYDPSKLV